MVTAHKISLRLRGHSWRLRCLLTTDPLLVGSPVEVSLGTADLAEALARAECIRRAYMAAKLITNKQTIRLSASAVATFGAPLACSQQLFPLPSLGGEGEPLFSCCAAQP
jgi:hypothetical protein